MIFTHKDKVMVYDTDYQGIAHYASYYRFVTNALSDLKEIHINEIMKKYEDLWFVIVESNAVYKKPLKLNDDIEIEIEPTLLSKKVVKFNFRIYKNKELTTSGYLIEATIDRKVWKATEMPEELAKKLSS